MPRHRAFLEEVTLLIGEPEREAFLGLREGYQRDRFLDRFWQVRDPFPQTARNEFRDRWEANAEAAGARFDDLSDHRAQMILFFGEESRSFRALCSDVLEPIEFWVFDAIAGVRPNFTIAFNGAGRERSSSKIWDPTTGLSALRSRLRSGLVSDQEMVTLITQGCTRGDQIMSALSRSVDWAEVRDGLPLRPRVAKEWVAAFKARSTDLPDGAKTLPASYITQYPGAYQSRTVVQVLVSVPRAEAAIGELGKHRSHNFLIDGEVLRRGELFESFRYKFDVAVTDDDTSEPIPLAVERYLRPGDYRIIVKVQDLNSDRFSRLQEAIEVPNLRVAPKVASAAATPPSEPVGRLEFLDEANASLDGSTAAADHVVRVTAPSDRLLTDIIRVGAKATGEGIAKVAFDLDGKQILAKTRPPYSIEIDLGRAPRIHRLQARAIGADGTTLASDETFLNTGPHRFGVRLIEPQRGHRYERSVRASAQVEIPEGEQLDRVEMYLNETLVATLFQPPFIQPIAIPDGQDLGYVRAVAFLEDGNSTEDLVFVNSPYPLDEVHVDMVELYTSVFDGKGRPVGDLALADFEVRENGEAQSIRRFEPVTERPIHAGILLDTSISMHEEIEEAEKAALKFFDSVLRPRDRACLIVFSDQPQLVVPFTNSVEILAGGLAGLVSEGETAFHDSLVFALHYFSGLRGKRVLIVISDGEDSDSRYRFEEVMEFARRAGVAIYSIGLGITQRDVIARNKLLRLADETGGRHFFIEDADGLSSIYAKIETEIRAQYLLAYQSSQKGSKFREVRLDMTRRGLKAKTMRGYYP
ncbi:MAG: VWA domain-containing protein [Acidobacteriota bacterium]|nr:VWA domain-containing protein [Acidobacteriota bacterium]